MSEDAGGTGLTLKDIEEIKDNIEDPEQKQARELLAKAFFGEDGHAKKLLLKFNGYQKGSNFEKSATEGLQKLSRSDMHLICKLLHLVLKGNKDEITERIMTFLQKPFEPEKKARKRTHKEAFSEDEKEKEDKPAKKMRLEDSDDEEKKSEKKIIKKKKPQKKEEEEKEEDEEEEDEQKETKTRRKSTKKKKDPEAPKKPLQSFFIYQEENRKK
ncbi:MAG: hypothetical protein EZS28_043119, partial [Streblomastix strix]